MALLCAFFPGPVNAHWAQRQACGDLRPRFAPCAACCAVEDTRLWPEAAEAVAELRELVEGRSADMTSMRALARPGQAWLRQPSSPGAPRRDPFYDGLLQARLPACVPAA